MGNFDFDIKFTDWLTFASVNSYKYNNILFKGYNDPRSKAGEADNGLLQDKTTTSYRVYSNQLLRFNKVFDKHSINAILAYEWNYLSPGKSRIRQRLVSLRASPWQM